MILKREEALVRGVWQPTFDLDLNNKNILNVNDLTVNDLTVNDLTVNDLMSIGKVIASNTKLDIGGIYDIANDVVYGIQNRGTINDTVPSAWYSRTIVALGASADITTVFGYSVGQATYTGIVTNQYAYYVEGTWIGASGLNIGFISQIPSGSGNWNFYAGGTADNYFNGNTGFGLSNPSEKLDVAGNIKLTGVVTASGGNSTNWNTAYDYSQVGHLPLIGGTITGNLTVDEVMSIGISFSSDVKLDIGGEMSKVSNTTYGIRNGGIVDDTVTSVHYNRTTVTLGASADVTTLVGYYIIQGTYIGAVTDQYGFYVENNFIGATGNNIGFRSNIPSGSGNWNFYAGGNADNYFEGNTGFGLDNPDEKVHVAGNIKADLFYTFKGTGDVHLSTPLDTGIAAIDGETYIISVTLVTGSGNYVYEILAIDGGSIIIISSTSSIYSIVLFGGDFRITSSLSITHSLKWTITRVA